MRKVRTGMMPPAAAPKPSPAARDAFASALEAQLDRAAALHPDPGATALHRLNRAEYANVIRDLLALDVDVSAMLPPDDSAAGFDNNADVLGVSPALIEGYASAAAKVSRLADRGSLDRPRSHDVPRAGRSRAGRAHRRPSARHTRWPRHSPHVPARRRVRHRRRRRRRARARRRPRRRTSRRRTAAARRSVRDARRRTTDARRARADTNQGRRRSAHDWRRVDRAHARRRRRQHLQRAGAHAGRVAGHDRRAVQCQRAWRHAKPPAAARLLAAAATNCAVRRRFSTRSRPRAYRRPVAASGPEMDTLLEFYREGRAGGTFESGLQRAVARVLVDPQFLFRFERDPVERRGRRAVPA